MRSRTTDFEDLLEAVPDAFVGVDRAGVIRCASHQPESLAGYERDALVGVPLEDLVPKSRRNEHRARREAYTAAPGTRPTGTDLNLVGQRRDGTELPVDISLAPTRTGDDLIVMAAVRDMTRHRKAEAERRRLDRMAALVEFSGEGIVGHTLTGIISSWNPAAERLFGFSGEEIVGKSGRDLNPLDRTAEVREILARIGAGEPVGSLETQRVRKDGTAFPAMLTISPIRDKDDQIVGACSITRDLTEQKQALQSAERLAAIVEQSPDAIVTTSLDGEVRSWNPAAERMFGYTSDEIVGRPGALLGPPEQAGEIDGILTAITSGEPALRIETVRVRKDGSQFPAALTASPIRDATGTISGASATIRDITYQRRTFESARSMIETSLDSFVAISPDGAITDANEATVRITGVPRDRLIGTSFSTYFTDPERAHEAYQLVFEQGSVTDYPLTLRPADGQEPLTKVRYNASLYRDADGSVLGVFASAHDVTKQVQARRELVEQQARELERLAELERFQRLTVGRELKMIELKKQIEYLRKHGPTDGGDRGDER